MEYLNVYDDIGNLLNKKVLRSEKKNLPNGKKFKIILVFIQNSKGEFYLSNTIIQILLFRDIMDEWIISDEKDNHTNW